MSAAIVSVLADQPVRGCAGALAEGLEVDPGSPPSSPTGAIIELSKGRASRG
jgi:anti-sigma-K factor RskA